MAAALIDHLLHHRHLVNILGQQLPLARAPGPATATPHDEDPDERRTRLQHLECGGAPHGVVARDTFIPQI